MMRKQQDPVVRLGVAYLDALHVAAEEVIAPSEVQALDDFADRLVIGLTEEPAWPTLRAHLLLLAVDGADPQQRLQTAYDPREVISAEDRAAVLDRRLGDTSRPTGGDGPLPWLPGIPRRIAADPTWGPYLNARSDLLAQLADQVRHNTAAEAPAWAAQPHALLSAELIADVQVWRAATQIHPCDLRPTGPSQLGGATRIFQQKLEKRLAGATADADRRWRQLLATEVPCVTADPFLPELAERLTNLTLAGFDATRLVRSAAATGPLPDDHPAAALWWRILDQLPQKPPATRKAVPPTRGTTAPVPVPRLRRPPAFGPSR